MEYEMSTYLEPRNVHIEYLLSVVQHFHYIGILQPQIRNLLVRLLGEYTEAHCPIFCYVDVGWAILSNWVKF